LLHVTDVMRSGADVPKVAEGAMLKEAIAEMTRGRIGMTAVLDKGGRVCGVFTDGDLRRALQKDTDVTRARVSEVMSRGPRSIRPEALAAEAVQIMEAHKVNQLLVVDARGELVGALNMHDLFRAKVI
jgi:arabinose-5-phosphate isomerase